MGNFSKAIAGIVFLALLLGTSGCTINVYRSQNPVISPAGDPLLVIPEPENKRVSPGDILTMSVAGDGFGETIKQMGGVELTLSSSVNAYVNCFYQEADGGVTKVFPNRYVKRYWLYAKQVVVLPASEHFQIVAGQPGEVEQFFCVASAEDVLKKLPRVFQANVFQPLPVANIETIFDIYNRETDMNIVGRAVSYEVGL